MYPCHEDKQGFEEWKNYQMKKSIIGYVFKSNANLDRLLYKDDCHVRLNGCSIDVKKDQHKKTYEELGVDCEESVKVKITIEILK